ncbi:DUF2789 domain-containing protein [Niveibacterium sp. SC-1]|uniref:DUF2789 domain-containing protein n=1 Tax=Niveibacterium sp. SC-1 TaxID=3135646 RepID=UPI00311E46CB
METPLHSMANLFAQLGLPQDPAAIDAFIASHAPLPDDIALAEAKFWTPAQAALLREALRADADWAEVVDQLSVRLRAPH